MEEAKALVSWEAIKDHLRNEDHNRNNEENVSATPLDSLRAEQLVYVREKYEKFTPYIRISFVLMTVLALIWDVMLMVRISPLFGMVEEICMYNFFFILGNYHLFPFNPGKICCGSNCSSFMVL